MNPSREWSGPLDQALLEKALAELKEICSSTEVEAQSQKSNWLLRNKLQGVQEIADLLGWSYLTEYDTFVLLVFLCYREYRHKQII